MTNKIGFFIYLFFFVVRFDPTPHILVCVAYKRSDDNKDKSYAYRTIYIIMKRTRFLPPKTYICVEVEIYFLRLPIHSDNL